MKRSAIAAALLCAGLSQLSHAGPIAGVTVTTTATACCDSSISHITDGSGLSSYTPGATHAMATKENVWATFDRPPGSLTFSLGGLHALDGLAIWNFNSNNEFSIKALTVLGSTDGTNYFAIPGAPTQLNQGPFLAAVLAQQFAVAATVSFVRFDIESVYGTGAIGGFGVAEVMFLGTAIPRSVPEPALLPLLACAAGLGIAVARSRRT